MHPRIGVFNLSLTAKQRSTTMKKSIFRLMTVAAAALTLVACTTAEPEAPATGNNDTVEVSLYATQSIVEDTSRSTLVPNDTDTAFDASWESGDIMGVCTQYSTDGASYTGKQTNAALTCDGNSFNGTMSTQEGATHWTYNAYYPYASSTSAIPFGNRVQNGNNFNGDYDLMYGVLEGVESATPGVDANGDPIYIDMVRNTAILYFHLTNTAEWANGETIQRAILTGAKWFAGTYAKYSTSSYAYSIESANRTTEIEMTFEEGTNPTANEAQLYFNIYTSQSNQKFTLTVYTENHKLVIENQTATNYENGKLYKIAGDTTDKWVEYSTGPLAAPAISEDYTVTHNSATFSWEAVEGAVGYIYKFGEDGEEKEISSTSAAYTDLEPETDYAITLYVKALGDGIERGDSDWASKDFNITTPAAPAAGSTTTYTWDFASAEFDGYATAITKSDNKTYVGTWNGLTITAGGGSIKMTTGGGVRCLRLGGSGSTTKRVLTYTANGTGTLTVVASNTGSSADAGRLLYVQTGTDSTGKQSVAAGEGTTDSPKSCEYSISVTEPTTIYIYTSASLNIYSVTYTETI